MNTKYLVARSAAVVAICLLMLGSGSAAHATTDESLPQESPIGFLSFGDSTFADVYDSLLQLNDSDDVAAALETIAESEAPNVEMLKLDSYSAEEAETILDEAAESARTGNQLAYSLRMGAESPVRGEGANAHHSWVYSDRAIYAEWEWVQFVPKAWIDFRVLTDPNDINSASQWNAAEGGDGRLSGFVLDSVVYQDGNYKNTSFGNEWSTPGYGTQWNFHDYLPNDGHTFQMEYGLTVDTPAGTTYAHWSTAISAPCGEPVPGAFRCLFP